MGSTDISATPTPEELSDREFVHALEQAQRREQAANTCECCEDPAVYLHGCESCGKMVGVCCLVEGAPEEPPLCLECAP